MFIVFALKSTIVSFKKYYRFVQKVLSFSSEANIELKGKYYL